eukprot:GCRY01006155.1.p1 GENE.GCRY01006155.1~~GCRY01006155.1.p1  ORF type:complete len:330 (+),score=38.33 GCRY01006155.1:125-1114(+)
MLLEISSFIGVGFLICLLSFCFYVGVLKNKVVVPSCDHSGTKYVVVTGGAKGIGYHLGLHCARFNMSVLLGCHNAEEGQMACDQIKREAKNPNVFCLPLDLCNPNSIKWFSKESATLFPQIDVLFLNAGVMFCRYELCSAKPYCEKHFQVNLFGHFVLTSLLTPKLLSSPAPRVICVSSIASKMGCFQSSNLQGEKFYNRFLQYCNTKYLQCLWACELFHHLEGKVTVHAVHPGVVHTDLYRHLPRFMVEIAEFLRPVLALTLAKRPAEGSYVPLAAAFSPLFSSKPPQYVDSVNRGEDLESWEGATVRGWLWNHLEGLAAEFLAENRE